MKLLWIIPALLFIDLLRSVFVITRLHRSFYHLYKPQRELYTLGTGPAYHIVLLGDSAIDGHGNNKIKFGPAQALIEKLAQKHTVTVHIFAKEGSKSYDVITNQLPRVRALNKVDMIFVYMGANNVIRGKRPGQVKDDYVTLLEYAKKIYIPVVASSVASYWMLKMFSFPHRLLIYLCNTSCNRQLEKLPKIYPNFVLLTGMSALTRKFITPEYMADELHPNDRSLRIWSEKVLSVAQIHPATKKLLA